MHLPKASPLTINIEKMDSKTLVSRLSMESGRNTEEVTRRLNAIVKTLGQFCGDLDAVAVPGFGTFQPVKTDEQVVTTPDGNRTLLPPAISVDFKVSVVLRKSLS